MTPVSEATFPVVADPTLSIRSRYDPADMDCCSDVPPDMLPGFTVDGSYSSAWHAPARQDSHARIERIVEEKLDEFEHRVLTHLRLQNRSTVTVSEAADLLGVSVYAVRRWLNEGRLKGNKHGIGKQGRWTVKVKDIERFLEKHSNRPKGDNP